MKKIFNSPVKRKTTKLVLYIIVFISILIFSFFRIRSNNYSVFDGERAYQDVKYQVDLGPRIPGTDAHMHLSDWLCAISEQKSWECEKIISGSDPEIINIVARRGNRGPLIIIGAHYDTRLWADNDPDPNNRKKPVIGANDGASGVAILTELSRTIPSDLEKQIWLVFFDAEDQGGIDGQDWIMGSSEFVNTMNVSPDAVIIVDMVGDRDLNLFYERNSDEELMVQIWETARNLGFSKNFIPKYKHSILDDHTPFLRQGYRAVDIIDFDYPYWHTVNDSIDKISSDSLYIVGQSLLTWLLEN
ncbi:MAG: M28 family peptidase [Bacteroidales bacterium]|nr:M28 family peptidase [Bacteroidales bacterium]